ncbi:12254_t:CDS:2, partial [Ambispora leptoticha]
MSENMAKNDLVKLLREEKWAELLVEKLEFELNFCREPEFTTLSDKNDETFTLSTYLNKLKERLEVLIEIKSKYGRVKETKTFAARFEERLTAFYKQARARFLRNNDTFQLEILFTNFTAELDDFLNRINLEHETVKFLRAALVDFAQQLANAGSPDDFQNLFAEF